LPAAEKAKWDSLLEPIVDKWIQSNTAKGLPAQQIVDDIKGLAKKHM
ncbi:MAG: C4-dicarboxylate ABC transporter substrate-binding protein, partial [Deltaproteobacteria bacterium]|nr:C4-dicarboxylate ABC transporter substrate-binding protein [Deltaproteobacteria bacterium]